MTFPSSSDWAALIGNLVRPPSTHSRAYAKTSHDADQCGTWRVHSQRRLHMSISTRQAKASRSQLCMVLMLPK